MMLDIDKGSKVTRPDFPKKSRFIHKVQKCGQNDFWDFRENGSNDFDKTLPNGRGDRYGAFAENRTL